MRNLFVFRASAVWYLIDF